MNSSQVNFYFTPADIMELALHIQDKWLMVPKKLSTNQLTYVQELDDLCYLMLPEHDALMQLKHVAQQGYYTINALDCPVIEFLPPRLDLENKVLKRGRMYYVKNAYDADGNLLAKDADFLQAAQKLFAWVRRHFKNAKPEGYKGLLVSQRAWEWTTDHKGTLPLNNISKKKSKTVESALAI